FPKTAWQDAEAVSKLLRALRDLGVTRLDSAACYLPGDPGRAEELLRETKDAAGSDTFLIDTKIVSDVGQSGGRGELTRQAIEASTAASLQRLQRPGGVADPTTPLEEQVQSFHEQIPQGHCEAWGVANVPAPMPEKMLQLCDQHGWTKPGCYQGQYNPGSRGMENWLLPLLRAHHMAFNGCQYVFDAGVEAHGLTSTEVAYRWLALSEGTNVQFDVGVLVYTFSFGKGDGADSERIRYHSSLGEDDGIILGASKLEQVTDTIALIRKGPPPDAVVSLAEELWAAVKGTRGNEL
ncbi:Aldo/keto reductase, partial [Apiospora aurea]